MRVYRRARSWRTERVGVWPHLFGQRLQQAGCSQHPSGAAGAPAHPTSHQVAGPPAQITRDASGRGRADRGRAPAGAQTGSLEGKGGVGDGPAVVGASDDGGVAHPGLGDEHLVEQGPPGHLPEGPDLDARLAHVEREVGDALVLGDVRIGPGQEHAEIGDLSSRGPHLLPGHYPLVAVALGPALQAGQVRAGSRLAEQLAPGLRDR